MPCKLAVYVDEVNIHSVWQQDKDWLIEKKSKNKWWQPDYVWQEVSRSFWWSGSATGPLGDGEVVTHSRGWTNHRWSLLSELMLTKKDAKKQHKTLNQIDDWLWSQNFSPMSDEAELISTCLLNVLNMGGRKQVVAISPRPWKPQSLCLSFIFFLPVFHTLLKKGRC